MSLDVDFEETDLFVFEHDVQTGQGAVSSGPVSSPRRPESSRGCPHVISKLRPYEGCRYHGGSEAAI